jgi:hypothetical protein
MGVQNIEQSKSVFQALLNDTPRQVKHVSDGDQQRAREAFYKAVTACDKATERMVDKHLENVKKSAERLAEYRRRKAVTDSARRRADDMRTINENILIERINHRNMLEEIRVREFNRSELLREADAAR